MVGGVEVSPALLLLFPVQEISAAIAIAKIDKVIALFMVNFFFKLITTGTVKKFNYAYGRELQ